PLAVKVANVHLNIKSGLGGSNIWLKINKKVGDLSSNLSSSQLTAAEIADLGSRHGLEIAIPVLTEKSENCIITIELYNADPINALPKVSKSISFEVTIGDK
ncbi:MAG: hypothetical protein RR396_04370, partial [Clostridiales bacterium]